MRSQSIDAQIRRTQKDQRQEVYWFMKPPRRGPNSGLGFIVSIMQGFKGEDEVDMEVQDGKMPRVDI
jgi:hypothetical protein